MLVGSQAIEVAKAQKQELKKTRKQLQAELQQQAELEIRLQEEEEDYTLIKEKFSSLAEELEFKTHKLEKLWGKYQEASEQLQSIGDDFDRERNDMYDTIFELTN